MPADTFLITPQTIQLNPRADYWFDVIALIDHLSACRNHAHAGRQTCPACLARLQAAVALYRGDFLGQSYFPDCAAFEEWALLKREWLRHQALEALSDLAQGNQAQGDYEAAYMYAWRQLELDPLCEAAHRQLMRSLAGQGRLSEALAQYQKCRDLLATELGVEPAVETTALVEQLKQGEVASARTNEYPPPKHNLPAELTPLVGRERELAKLACLIDAPDIRLVTILGPGGIGKTKLALAAALAHSPQFREGVYFVPLVGLDASKAIPTAIAQALNFTFYGGDTPLDQLAAYLRQKQVLLVLDNFEHVRDGVDSIITLLQAAPDLQVLATSRIKLAVQGEHLFPLGGLALPLETAIQLSGAEQLFLQAARQVRPDFKLTATNQVAVAQICRLVQGMPLGILLSAAWVEILSPDEIVEQLGGRDDSQALNFLVTDWQDVPERQRSLRAVCDHSWRLLSQTEQTAFQQLSVFRGGFTREAAGVVAAISLPGLMKLVDKSLLHRAASGRYEVHELLRQYGYEKLEEAGQTEAALASHAAYYLDRVAQLETDLKGRRHLEATAEIEADNQNIQLAWRWAVEHYQFESVDRAIEALTLFFDARSYFGEGFETCELVATLWSDHPDAQKCVARALIRQSDFSRRLGHHASVVQQRLQQGLSLLAQAEASGLEIRADKALALLKLGYLTVFSDAETAYQYLLESLALSRAIDDPWLIAWALRELGKTSWGFGQIEQAKAFLEESVAIRRSLGNRSDLAASLVMLGSQYARQGDLETHERLAQEAYECHQETGERHGTSRSLLALGNNRLWRGDFSGAQAILGQAWAIAIEYNDRHHLNSLRWIRAEVSLHLGEYAQALVWGEETLEQARQIGLQSHRGDAFLRLGMLKVAGHDYAEARDLLAESETIFHQTGQPVKLGDLLGPLSLAYLGLADLKHAQNYLLELLQMSVLQGIDLALQNALPVAALYLAKTGQSEPAVEMYALATCVPFIANSHWWDDVVGQYIAAIAQTLPVEGVEAAQARGRVRDLAATAAELLSELQEPVSQLPA